MSREILYEQTGVAMTCRSYEEYVEMFKLTTKQLEKGTILDVAAGASSFVAKAKEAGYEASAVDPLYRLSFEEVKAHATKEMQIAEEKIEQNAARFLWDSYKNLQNHKGIRQQSLQLFLKSYENDNELYVTGELPRLPFSDHRFSLTMCNHFLFLYQAQFSQAFHYRAIAELLRVTARGGRILIYPLVGFNTVLFPALNELITAFTNEQAKAELVNTDFRFLPEATQFLQITKH